MRELLTPADILWLLAFLAACGPPALLLTLLIALTAAVHLVYTPWRIARKIRQRLKHCPPRHRGKRPPTSAEPADRDHRSPRGPRRATPPHRTEHGDTMKTTATAARFVTYTISADDAEEINQRRDNHRAVEASHHHKHEPAMPGATGLYGNDVAEGEEYPALVVKTFEDSDAVNLQVFLDGNDTHWATDRKSGDETGTWR